MSDSVFLDTNVLVYAIESCGPDPDKTSVAQLLTRRDDVILSTQVLGEFYRVVTSPRRLVSLNHEEAVAWVQLWSRHDVRGISISHVDLALEIVGRYRINYYDALIVAAARLANCETVYSEDLNAGQDYGGVKVVNPFQKGPTLGTLK